MKLTSSSLAFALALTFSTSPLFAQKRAATAKPPAKSEKPAKQNPAAQGVQGWLDWRGPEQSGVSHETGLPVQIDAKRRFGLPIFPGNRRR
jgi:hypothetical protein